MAREIFRSVSLRSMFSVTPASKGFPTAGRFDLVLGFVIRVRIINLDNPLIIGRFPRFLIIFF